MAHSDFYLKIDGIDGESKDEKKKDHIEIESFSMGGSNAASLGKGSGGAGTSRVALQDLHFTKLVDKSSPGIFAALCSGQHFKTATLTVRKAGGDPKDYLTITLTTAFVTSYNKSGHNGGGLPTETFSLGFDKIEMEYKPQDEKGGLGGAIKKSYEHSTHKVA